MYSNVGNARQQDYYYKSFQISKIHVAFRCKMLSCVSAWLFLDSDVSLAVV